MLQTLIKKQFTEVVMSISVGKRKKGAAFIGVAVYLLIFVALAMSVAGTALMIAEPLIGMGLDWIYMAYMCLLAVIIGCIGTVFNTYSVIYKAKDNELLLSLPIKPGQILFAKIFSEYVFSLFFSGAAMIPAIVLWIKLGNPTGADIVFTVLTWFVLALFSLVLACVLAWVIALVTSHVRNSNFLIIILSIAVIVAYFYVFSDLQSMLGELITASMLMAEDISGAKYILYYLGMGATGSIAHFIVVTLIIIALFTLLYVILAKSFISIATSNKGVAKKAYVEKKAKMTGVSCALFGREVKRLVSSSAYFLNACMGLCMLVVAAVALQIKKDAILGIIVSLAGENGDVAGIFTIVICAFCAMTIGMTNITAPSVSLEGKSLWLLQSLPVKSEFILDAKALLAFVFEFAAGLVFAISAFLCYSIGIGNCVLVIAFLCAYSCFTSMFGLFLGLKLPKFDWTNEITVIKQSAASTIAMLGGMGIVFVFVGLYMILWGTISNTLFLILLVAILVLADVILYWWISNKGTKIFENL